MSRSGTLKVPTAGYGATSPLLHGLAIITEGKSLQDPESIPDISIDESFLTSGARHTIAKKKKDETSLGQTSIDIPPDSLCGARIAIYRHSGNRRALQKRIGTIGGVFTIGERHFALTAAHIFFDNEGNMGSWNDSGLYVTSNSDSNDDQTHPRARISETYEVVIESYWPNAADPSLHTKPTNISLGLVAPPVLHRRKAPDAATLPEVIWDDKLDWALIELKNASFWQLNKLQVSPKLNLHLKPPSFNQEQPMEDVLVAAGVSGTAFGEGVTVSERVRLPWSKSIIESWTLKADLASGDCGSLVVCPETGTVYGMLVAHNSESSVAHIVPALLLFESIRDRYKEGTASLEEMFRSSSPVSSSSTLAERKPCEEYLRMPVVRSAETDVTKIFASHLTALSLQSVHGRRFVRRTALVQWLLSERRDRIPIIDFMLDDAYPRTEMLPITSDQLSGGDETYLLVFCILYELGQAHLIHLFVRQGLTDSRLPFDQSLLQEAATRMDLDNKDSIVRDIFGAQWAYCPMHFDLEMERDVAPQTIIPIHQRHQINSKSGSGILWQITVLEEFVGKRLRAASTKARFNDAADRLGYRYHFAVKSSSKYQQAHFEGEIAAFKAFRSIPSIIGYLGNFNQTIAIPKKETTASSTREEKTDNEAFAETNNILLEYGDFDLDEFFAANQPPVLPIQITQFWQDIAGIAEAISELHQFSMHRAGVKQEYAGWHADLKPDNVLSVKGIFKLADPGFARVEKSDKKLTKLVGGTRTFGSPEVHSSPRMQENLVSQAIDIWSLGCVLSVAATWVALGWSGVTQFQQLRIDALGRLSTRLPGRKRSRSRSTGRTSELSFNSRRGIIVPEGDCFHDGKNVLEEVHQWHAFLRSVVRKSDEVTVKILDMIDTKMLVSKPTDRIDAIEVYNQIRLVVHEGETSNSNEVPDVVTKMLLNVDSLATTARQTASTATLASTRTEHGNPSPNFKSSNRSLHPPSPQVAHGPKLTVDVTPTISNENDDDQAVPQETRTERPFRNILLNEAGGRSISSSIDIPMSQLRTAPTKEAGLKPARRLSVSQARAEVDKKKKVFSRKRKDPLLTKHLENRDIEFLIDNGDTMAKYWNEMKELIDILCSMVTDVDRDGFDLSFTTGPIKLKQKSNSRAVKSTMDHDRAKPVPGTRTDMSTALDHVLSQHAIRVKSRSSRSSSRNYTLIVLTDGVWRGMNEPHAVEDTIIRSINEIARLEGSKRKQRSVTIQFIQFGNNEEATSRLQMLDRGLVDYEIPDIIDTEPSNGNVWKMLLGSVEASFDYADSGA